MCKQLNQIGVREIVVHQKSRINGIGVPFEGDIHRVGMPTKIRTRLKQCDMRVISKQPSRGQARNTRADHCDPAVAGDAHFFAHTLTAWDAFNLVSNNPGSFDCPNKALRN